MSELELVIEKPKPYCKVVRSADGAEYNITSTGGERDFGGMVTLDTESAKKLAHFILSTEEKFSKFSPNQNV